MPVEAIVLVVIIVVAVLVIAAYLISLASSLLKVASNLSTVNRAIADIPRQTEPVGPIVESLKKDLREAQTLLEGILAKPRGAAAPTAPPGPGPAGRGPGATPWS
ncbi:MAG: hypothetical protein DLM61_24485 [Pseudonocardiales bacterium]|nr:MAG: hypothetical protein DLM61_24485 [Pseudonocardiales bacterium]